jgi:hypothetical protein
MSRIRRASALLLLAALSAGACSDSSTGPEEPDVPNVAGTWTGEFRDGSLRLVLSQSGSEVAGTLGFGRSEQPLTGSVDAAGMFVFVTEPAAANCVVYSSSRGLQLENQGGEMNGVMVRSSKSPPCDEPGRTLVEQGSAALTRAF